MSLKIYIDGEYFSKEDAKISVFDHGLLYGDGVFEGIRSYNRLVFKLEEHIDRLFDSAKSILLEIPLTKEEMIDAVIATLKLNNLDNAYIRLIVTRGVGNLGLDPRKCHKASIIIITDQIQLYPQELYERGLNIITAATQKSAPEALNPRIKSLNYLNNILAKIEAINSGCEEALMFNSLGKVTECTGDNIFIVKEDKLMTPSHHVGILNGITRQAVIEIARQLEIEMIETILSRHDIFTADECFLTGTAAEIISVVRIDNRVVGSGQIGKMTLKLSQEFKRITQHDGVRY